ncbi:MAG: hypothetical protein BWX66_01923 [Deltaproteobacteria bacterium ADurb.Bin058]|nr:MAG: hypothetical protein BWX66_01923 [Deltaproteobacteria bacterium ADurb.Bin058]
MLMERRALTTAVETLVYFEAQAALPPASLPSTIPSTALKMVALLAALPRSDST